MSGWYIFILVLAFIWFAITAGQLARHLIWKVPWEGRQNMVLDMVGPVGPLVPIVLILTMR
jgi:hypothetical protein